MKLKGCIPAANRNCVQHTWTKVTVLWRKKYDSLYKFIRTQGHLRNTPNNEIGDTVPSLYELARTGPPVMQPGFSGTQRQVFYLKHLYVIVQIKCSSSKERGKKKKKKIMTIQNSSSPKERIKNVISRKLFPQMWKEPLRDHSLVG